MAGGEDLKDLMTGSRAKPSNQAKIVTGIWKVLVAALFPIAWTVLKLVARTEAGEEVTKEEKAKPYHRYVDLSRIWDHMERLRTQWTELVPGHPFPVLKDEAMVKENYEMLVQYFAEGSEGLDKVPYQEEPETVYEEEGETEQEKEKAGTSKAETGTGKGKGKTSFGDGLLDDLLGGFSSTAKSVLPQKNPVVSQTGVKGVFGQPGTSKGISRQNQPIQSSPGGAYPGMGRLQSVGNRSFSPMSDGLASLSWSRPHFDRHAFALVPVFAGDLLEYADFMGPFLEVIGNSDLTVVLKLRCLKMKLVGAALLLISSYRSTDYEVVLAVLEYEYTSLPNVLSRLRVQAQSTPQVVSVTHVGSLSILVARLRASKNLIDHHDLDVSFALEVFRIFLAKVPWDMVKGYVELVGTAVPDLRDFLVHLETELMTLRNRQWYYLTDRTAQSSYSRPDMKKGQGYGNRRYGAPGQRAMAVQDRPTGSRQKPKLEKPCGKCGSDRHTKLRCSQYTWKERYQVAREYNLCLICLDEGHVAKECKSNYRCKVCNGRHNWLFCRVSTYGAQPQKGNYEQSPSQEKQAYNNKRPFNKQPMKADNAHQVEVEEIQDEDNAYLAGDPQPQVKEAEDAPALEDLEFFDNEFDDLIVGMFEDDEDFANNLYEEETDEEDEEEEEEDEEDEDEEDEDEEDKDDQGKDKKDRDDREDEGEGDQNIEEGFEMVNNLEDEEEYINVIEGGQSELNFVPLSFNLKKERFTGMLDTGASVNLFPIELANKLKVESRPRNRSLITPQGKFNVSKAFSAAITIGFITKIVEFLLYGERPVILLGTPILRRFKLTINYNCDVVQEYEKVMYLLDSDRKLTCFSVTMQKQPSNDPENPKELEFLLRCFKVIFAESGSKVGLITTEKCKINLTDIMPISQRPYRVTTKDQAIIDKQIEELLAQKMIRTSTSTYSFPVVLVSKKDEGEKSRLCINYIKLNLVTITELFPMPRIEDMKDLFLGAKWFTTVDISQGFYHIEVEEDDKRKTAFSTATGHYEWNRMPFGLKNAPIIFQRVISNILKKHKLNAFAINYIDDIVVFSKSYSEHLVHLEKLFKMLAEENIRLKLSKCQFAKKSVVYLGFQIERDSFRPLNSNTEAIEKVPPPENVHSLRSFIGKVGFYNRFVPNRAKLLYPLYQLIKKGTPWNWDEEAQQAFNEVKKILTTEPVLQIFNPEYATYLYVDASRKGLGAVLKQSKTRDPKEERLPVGFFSKTLLQHQRNYSVTEIELLAIISAVAFWHFYLIGHFFVIVTDHAPLKAIHKFDKIGTRLYNWAMTLRQYDFRVEYIPGETNKEADFLSRHPIELLWEATQNQVNWVEECRIKKAQQECSLVDLPKRVKDIGNQQERRLVYIKGDLQKSYLPKELAKEALQELHQNKGHIGQKQMELHFVRKYYTPNLADLLVALVLACDHCARVKKTGRRYGTLGEPGQALKPFDVVHIDTKSGFKRMGSVKEHLHLAIDGFTRFAWSVESKTKIATDFINLINKVMTIKKPLLVIADNYPSIRGREFREFLESHGIGILFISVNHQSTNGLCERLNQTLMEKIKCGKLDRPRWAWTTVAKDMIQKYNRTIHTITKYTPVYLLIGEDEDKLFQNETLEESRLQALKNSRQAHEVSARAHDTSRKDPDFEAGDMVYVQAKHALNRKPLDPMYEGPYEVKGRIGQTTYEIDRQGKQVKKHVSQLKPTKLPKTTPRERTLLANMTLMVIAYFSGVDATQPKLDLGGPIVWKLTKHEPVSGYNYTTHVAIMEDPCFALQMVHKKDPNSAFAKSDYDICKYHYKTKMQRPIRKNCKPAQKVEALGMQSHHIGLRHRRFVILAAIGIGILVGIVSYGVMTLASRWIDNLVSDKVDKVEDQLKHRMEVIKNETAKNIAFQEELLKKLRTDNNRVHHLEEELVNMTRSTRHLMASTEMIGEIGMHLEYLFHGFKHGKVTTDYEILFEDNPLLKGTPIQHWVPHECSYIDDEIIFRFEIPVIPPDLKILKADAFQVIKTSEDGQKCLEQFKGNKLVLFDEKTNCSRDLFADPVTDHDLMLVDPENHICVNHQSQTTGWKSLYCGKEVAKHHYVQYKENKSHFFVYCLGHKIRAEGLPEYTTCENVIYKIPRTKGFTVDGHRWIVRRDNYTSKTSLPTEITDLINQRTFNTTFGPESNFTSLEKLILDEKDLAKQIKWDKVATSPYIWSTVITVFVVILAIIAIVCLCRWYRTKAKVKFFQKRHANVMRMNDLKKREQD